jgi:hypothetical protein
MIIPINSRSIYLPGGRVDESGMPLGVAMRKGKSACRLFRNSVSSENNSLNTMGLGTTGITTILIRERKKIFLEGDPWGCHFGGLLRNDAGPEGDRRIY